MLSLTTYRCCIYIVLLIYICSSLLPNFVIAQTRVNIEQATKIEQENYIKDQNNKITPFLDHNIDPSNDITHIVSLFVDVSIYNSIKAEIQRYTTQYIQKKLPRTKVLVFPISNTISPQDIARINDNLYHDGVKGRSSRLVWTIVVWAVTLPTVRNENKSTTSIYPWVDFEDVQFPRDASGQIFKFAGNVNGQAEIWHGVIDFGVKVEEYQKFFKNCKYTMLILWLMFLEEYG